MAGRAYGLIVVLDASTLVSAALKTDSIPERALLQILNASNRLIISQAVEDEYSDVLLRPKFDRFVSRDRRRRILGVVATSAYGVEPSVIIRECLDPKDDKYLELAIAGTAGVIVSSDRKHLLSMHPWRGMSILSPADFLAVQQ